MFANVSHEFRTPLNAIIYSNESIQKSLHDLKKHLKSEGNETFKKFEKWL